MRLLGPKNISNFIGSSCIADTEPWDEVRRITTKYYMSFVVDNSASAAVGCILEDDF
jgi:hypothetical protein